MICECHRESGSHESCCGHPEGRSPDCPIHGDGSGPHAVRQPIYDLADLTEVLVPAWPVCDNALVRRGRS